MSVDSLPKELLGTNLCGRCRLVLDPRGATRGLHSGNSDSVIVDVLQGRQMRRASNGRATAAERFGLIMRDESRGERAAMSGSTIAGRFEERVERE